MLNHRWQSVPGRKPIPAFPDAVLCMETCLIAVNRSTLIPDEQADDYINSAALLISSYLQQKYPLQPPEVYESPAKTPKKKTKNPTKR